MKFVIVSGRQGCGGTIVLHALCKELNDMGFNAKMYYTWSFNYKRSHRFIYYTYNCCFFVVDLLKVFLVKLLGESVFLRNPHFVGYVNTTISGTKRKFLPFVGKNTIVVYPEIVYGNPLHAKNVVRWFLYFYRYENQDDAYSKNDLFIAYREIFNNLRLNSQRYMLHTPYFNLDLYKRTNFKERTGICYIIRKGHARSDLPANFDGPILDNLAEKDKVEMLNKYQYCVSYDTQTAYSSLAALCGCISVVVPEKDKGRRDYLKSGEEGFGVAYGFDEREIKFALATQGKLKERYEKLNKDGRVEVEKFVELCKDFFKLGEKNADK